MQRGGRTGSPGRPPLRSMTRLILAQLFALALAAALMPAAPAAAADGNFGGITCALGPGSAYANSEAIASDIRPGGPGGGAWDPLDVLDVDEWWAFVLWTPAVCTSVDAVEPDTTRSQPAIPPTAVTISGNGTHQNVVCGTGRATGTLRIDSPWNVTGEFGIAVVGGVGTLTVRNLRGTIGDEIVDGGDGTGAIAMATSTRSGDSTNPGLPGVQCATANGTDFRVAGGFNASLSGPTSP